MPCNLYGPNDNYDENNSHFFPAITKKILIAKKKNKKIIKVKTKLFTKFLPKILTKLVYKYNFLYNLIGNIDFEKHSENNKLI